jgi:energy-coupling factor transport system ATP-binding protein
MTATAVSSPRASIRAVTFSYPDATRPALDAASLALGEGVTAITGTSGSGKSTLLRLLNGLVPNFHGGRIRGGVTVAGMDAMRTPTARLARQVGFVFQDPETQMVRAHVSDEVAFALENTAVPEAQIRDWVDWAMDAAGISDLRNRTTASLSGGERQRVAIAAAIALRPAVLALDEPTSQLDRAGSADVLRACRDLAAAGTAVIISEHRCAALLPLADHLGQMSGGRLSGPGPVREMATRMDDPPPLVALARALGWNRVPLSVEEAAAMAPALRRPAAPPVSTAAEAAWELRRCAAGHDRTAVFADVDLGGAAGEVIVLMGSNGGGKTTLMRTIAGLQKPLSGSAWRQPGRVAYLPQDPAVLLHRRSVQDEVDYTLKRAGSPEARDLVLRRLGLADLASRYPGDLSSGQRQRAALAAILAGSPRLVLLDEPTRGMDAAARQALVRVVREMAAAGASVVVATHDADLAADLADRVLFVEFGSVRDGGHPERALSGSGAYATDVGRLYPGGPVTVEGLLACR